MKMKSAPDATPAIKASQPQWRPMTSTTKAREWENAVELMLSMASQIRWSAVEAPIVRSVILMSLSIDPTRPTILRCAYCFACSSVIFCAASNSLTRSGHSERKTSAPVSEPSPPHIANASMPSMIRLWAASSRPSCVRNAAERAVPMRVPPYRGGVLF